MTPLLASQRRGENFVTPLLVSGRRGEKRVHLLDLLPQFVSRHLLLPFKHRVDVLDVVTRRHEASVTFLLHLPQFPLVLKRAVLQLLFCVSLQSLGKYTVPGNELGGLFVGCLLNVLATCQCISGTDLHRQFYVLPH